MFIRISPCVIPAGDDVSFSGGSAVRHHAFHHMLNESGGFVIILFIGTICHSVYSSIPNGAVGGLWNFLLKIAQTYEISSSERISQ